MNVSEIMTPKPATVSPTASLRAVMRRLLELDVRHLPVVEDGALRGIVSDRDLRDVLSRLLEESGPGVGSVWERPVGDVMSGDVLSVDPEADVGEVIDIMIEHKIGAIPVVSPGTDDLVGIVSYIDVLRAARDNM